MVHAAAKAAPSCRGEGSPALPAWEEQSLISSLEGLTFSLSVTEGAGSPALHSFPAVKSGKQKPFGQMPPREHNMVLILNPDFPSL